MTWIDGILMLLVSCAAALTVSYRRETRTARAGEMAARDELAAERTARDADRAAFDEERRFHLYDHRQLVSRRILLEGSVPLDEPLRNTDEPEREYDLETIDGVEQALEELQAGGRMSGNRGPVRRQQDEHDRLMTLLEDLKERRTHAGTPTRSTREPQSPYNDDEQPMTNEDYAAIDTAAH